jgi:hypothetical protein
MIQRNIPAVEPGSEEARMDNDVADYFRHSYAGGEGQ